MKNLSNPILLLLVSVLTSACIQGIEKPDCSDLSYSNREKIILTSMSPESGGVRQQAGYYHRLVLQDYFDDCIGSIPFLAIAYHYIDTVQQFRPIRGVEFYDAETPFIKALKSGEEEIHEEVAESLIVGFSFLVPYDSIESRQFHTITFSRGGHYVSFPLEGVALEKKMP